MNSSKVRKMLAFILAIQLVLSLVNPSYPGYSYAAGTDTASLNTTVDSSVKDTMTEPSQPSAIGSAAKEKETPMAEPSQPVAVDSAVKKPQPVNKDEFIYPSFGDNKIFMAHESNMPKTKEATNYTPPITRTNTKTTEADVKEAPNDFGPYDLELEGTEQSDNSVSGSVYGNTLEQKSITENGATYQNTPLTVALPQIDESVNSSVYHDFPIKNRGGSFSARFSQQSGKNLLHFSYGNTSLNLTPQNCALVPGNIDKNSITYKNIYPQTDLRYISEVNRLKEDIFVKEFTGQNVFSYTLSVNNAVYTAMPNGKIFFCDATTGELQFHLDKPYALDKNGSRCDSIEMSISEENILTLTIDSDWLKKAVYPVVIDPSIIVTEFYLASKGFNGTQGPMWYYEERDSSGNYYQMAWQDEVSYWMGNNSRATMGYNWQKPGLLTYGSSRTWKAPHSGRITITGKITKNENGGDGVYVGIFKNSTLIWGWKNIAPLSFGNLTPTLDIPVNSGDLIRFVLTPNIDTSHDNVRWDPLISYENVTGTGIEPFYNYTSKDLGGGWGTSVNTYNLNLVLNKTLFAIPGRGLPFGESLTYNSLDIGEGPVGLGWHLGNNCGLYENPSNGDVTLVDGDGSYHVFTYSSYYMSYTPPPGLYLKLRKAFSLTDKYQNTYIYSPDGKPLRFYDRNNNTTTFSYDSNGRLCRVTDPSGRYITYTYNSAGLVSTITDPANHTYQFFYQDDRLSKIVDPANNAVLFGYDANGHLSTFTDPLNRGTTFSCASDGTMQYYLDARSNSQNSYKTSFSQYYEDDAKITNILDPSGNSFAFGHNTNGNLRDYYDPYQSHWFYGWSNNNLAIVMDAKGTTTYEYDSNGNVTKRTCTVDGNTSNNIVETMTYDTYSHLLDYVDGSGRETSHYYDNMGNLLSTTKPDIKYSNGKYYDSYGNVLQYSPTTSATWNQIENGSMESLQYWSEIPGGATVSLEGFGAHGNSALKMTCTSPTTHWFRQVTKVSTGDKLTLRADIKLDNVQYSGSGGAAIMIDYGNGSSEKWYYWGTGTMPIVLTSQAASNTATVYVGLYNASGTAWFDGIQLEKAITPDEGYILSEFNPLENSGFEYGGTTSWNYTGGYYFSDNTTSPYAGTRSMHITSSGGIITLYQDVPVYGGEPMTFSGIARTNGPTVYFKIDYQDASKNIIPGATVQTSSITGTSGYFYTKLTCLADAPSSARYARVTIVYDATNSPQMGADFDAIKLIPRNTAKYTYSPSGNYMTVSEDPLGKQSTYSYNESAGTLSSFSDALNNTTYYYYDNLNRLVDVNDPLARHAYYDYDQVSNLTATHDPRSSASTDNTYMNQFAYNNINQLNTLTDPASRNSSYAYDNNGNLTGITLPNGLVINYAYDKANRLSKKTLDGGVYYTYSYDGANELTGVVDQNSKSYSYNYDGAHRVIYAIDPFGYRLDYQWDKSNNLTSAAGTNTGTIQYQYGKSNRLLSVTLPDSLVISYHYDENGRVFQTRYPGSYNYRNISYCRNGWVDKIQDLGFPNKTGFYYTYYDNGNIASIYSWAGNETFTYDKNGRLTQWTLNGTPENYQYDAAGNLLVKGSNAFTYNNANQVTNSGFTYDANGNLTSDGTFNYVYDAEDKLVQVKKVSDSSLVATYTYNHDGMRRSKTVYTGGSQQITNYHWDAFGHLARESDTGGNTLACYYYSPGGSLIGIKKNNQTYINHANLRGDVVSVTDTSNNIVAQYQYDPWGKQIAYSGTLSQPFRYAGYYYDDETGLYYLKNRYYSPSLGRFLTKDKIKYLNIKHPDTLNLYTYAYNNPVSYIDPKGNNPLAVIALIGADLEAASIAALATAAAASTAEAVHEASESIREYFSRFNPTKYPWNGLPSSGSYPFNPPVDKAGNPVYRKGDSNGAVDQDSNEWKWDKGAARNGNPHWDVQHPDGSHTNVNPESSDRPGEINHGDDNF